MGTFAAISAVELRHAWVEFTSWKYYLGDLDILGLMLLGLYVGRIGAIGDRATRLSLARKHVYWLVGAGFLCGTTGITVSQFGLVDDSSTHLSVVTSLLTWPLGMPVLGLGYAAAIAILMDSEPWRRRMMVFAPIGRMALTNYLFTCFVAALISFQWGLGLYGKMLPLMGVVIAAGLLPVQILVSRWWLRNFAFGPFEWLWRFWTYGRPPPIRQEVGYLS